MAYSEGRLHPPGFSSRFVTGTYKGIPFRSSFEYAFMKLLESRGHVLGVDVLYEPDEFRITYVDVDGKQRTYFPDFYVIPERTLYEVKPLNLSSHETNVAKFASARVVCEERSVNFVVITEDDLEGFMVDRDCMDADESVLLTG